MHRSPGICLIAEENPIKLQLVREGKGREEGKDGKYMVRLFINYAYVRLN